MEQIRPERHPQQEASQEAAFGPWDASSACRKRYRMMRLKGAFAKVVIVLSASVF